MAFALMTDAISAVAAIFALDSFQTLTSDQLFERIHTGHNHADLTFPAVTIGPLSLEPRRDDAGFSGSDLIENYEVILEIRLHNGYTVQPMDYDLVAELTDDIIEQLKTHINATATYRLMDCAVLGYTDTFSESDTVGATVRVTLHTVASYSQE